MRPTIHLQANKLDGYTMFSMQGKWNIFPTLELVSILMVFVTTYFSSAP